MENRLRNTIVLGVSVAAVTLGGISVLAASNTPENGTRFTARSEMSMPDADRENKRVMNFSWAVEKGIISQNTSDKLTVYFEETAEAKKAEMDKIRNMTADEREALFNGNKQERKDIFEELVSAGIITESEAAALKEAMPSREAPPAGLKDGENAQGFGRMNFDSLIESGVIDQATADKMEAYMTKKADEMKAEMETRGEEMKTQMDGMKQMTPEEHKALFESGSAPSRLDGARGIIGIKEPFDIFEEMFKEGIISEDQANAIKQALPQRKAKVENANSL